MLWRQVEQAAYAKHGGPDGLEEARLRRISTRTEARKKKRSAREAKVRIRLWMLWVLCHMYLEALSQHTLSEARVFIRQGAGISDGTLCRFIAQALLSVCDWCCLELE